jgi:hypothetical protein
LCWGSSTSPSGFDMTDKTDDCTCELFPGCLCPTCNTCEDMLKGETE